MFPMTEDQIDAAWLTGVLRRSGTLERGSVRTVRAERIAEGVALLSRVARLSVQYEGAPANLPASMIAKLPIDLPRNLEIARGARFYERECSFYERVSGRAPLRVPHCYGIERGEDAQFVLLLEDLGTARVGDQLAGSSPEQALLALAALAEHHATFWGQTSGMEFLVDYHAPFFCQVVEQSYKHALPRVLEAYPHRFTPALRETAKALADKTTVLLLRHAERPLTVVHGDFRADNLLFDLPDGAPLAVIDWQVSGRGFGPLDLGFHLTQSVASDVRCQIERPAVEAYHRTLIAHGISAYGLADLWEEYREIALFALTYPVVACGAIDLTNERARALGDVWLTRSLDAITDLRAVEKLPV